MRRLILLISLVLPLSAHAADKLCAPLCSSDRQSCRAGVQTATELDKLPALGNDSSKANPNTRMADKVESRFEQQRPTESQAFRQRRAERLQTCEANYRRCAVACEQK